MLIIVMFLDNSKFCWRIVKMLMNYGVKVKVLDKFGWLVLLWVCFLGWEDMVKLFFSYFEVDFVLESIDFEGNINLMLVSMLGNVNIVKIILKVFRRNRFDVNRVNNCGKSVLKIVYSKKFMDCVEVFLNEGYVILCVDEINLLWDVFSVLLG